MQSLSVKKGKLKSTVEVPSSKSYANRALIIASLKTSKTTIQRLPKASDVTILIDCLKQLGLKVNHHEDEITFLNSFPSCETTGKTLNVGEGGTTARFLAAMVLLGSERYILKLGERLKDRPWKEFIDQVKGLGGEAKLVGNELTLKGPVTFPAKLEVDCSKTTQFATAFQLAGAHVNPVNLDASQSYWRMTEKMIEDMTADTYAVPLDWSSASYPLAYAALNQKIIFPSLQYDDFQSDAKFLKLLKEFNAVIEISHGLEIHPGQLIGDVNFDVSDALDLVPTLGFYLAHIKGTHILCGVKNLVHKESDRLHEVMKLLKIFGRKTSVSNDSLIIEGNNDLVNHPVDLTLPDDHRMVMVGTLFLLHHQGGTIKPAEAVNKSYPEFFNLISSP